ncbi:hypothetical protein IW140_001279 [Coemansia sp. RSA 1813]|nr:hypothetical protein EV178_001132 [Coemansia sp. RSA 1646]KAJ2571929.1 hypothetical protein IW140_001279 [Coemansia sp. RSA 1813]
MKPPTNSAEFETFLEEYKILCKRGVYDIGQGIATDISTAKLPIKLCNRFIAEAEANTAYKFDVVVSKARSFFAAEKSMQQEPAKIDAVMPATPRCNLNNWPKVVRTDKPSVVPRNIALIETSPLNGAPAKILPAEQLCIDDMANEILVHMLVDGGSQITIADEEICKKSKRKLYDLDASIPTVLADGTHCHDCTKYYILPIHFGGNLHINTYCLVMPAMVDILLGNNRLKEHKSVFHCEEDIVFIAERYKLWKISGTVVQAASVAENAIKLITANAVAKLIEDGDVDSMGWVCVRFPEDSLKSQLSVAALATSQEDQLATLCSRYKQVLE